MRSIYSVYMLVDKYATEIEKLDLDGAELEEYCTVLLDLQNQVESGQLSDRIVSHCLESLKRFVSKLRTPLPHSLAV